MIWNADRNFKEKFNKINLVLLKLENNHFVFFPNPKSQISKKPQSLTTAISFSLSHIDLWIYGVVHINQICQQNLLRDC